METREPDIVANAAPHSVEFWRRQPSVEKVELLRRDVGADGTETELAIWLRPGAADEPFDEPVHSTPPDREADLFLSAGGLCEASWFWDRLDGVEHSVYMEDFGPEFWGVELWLTEPEQLKPTD